MKIIKIFDYLLLDVIFKQEKEMIEECKYKENYKREKILLILTTILSSIVPLLISVLGTSINNNFNLYNFIKSGEILVLFYTLLAGTTIEAISINETNILSSKAIILYRIICIIMLLYSFGLYAILRLNEANSFLGYFLFCISITTLNLFTTLYICFLGLKFKLLSNSKEYEK